MQRGVRVLCSTANVFVVCGGREGTAKACCKARVRADADTVRACIILLVTEVGERVHHPKP